MLQEQNNSCYICLEAFIKRASVDHCHKSGKIRRLLCNNCNVALGNVKDNPEILKKMIIYLEEHGT